MRCIHLITTAWSQHYVVGKNYYKRGWLSPSFLRHFLPVFTKWGSLKTTIFVASWWGEYYQMSIWLFPLCTLVQVVWNHCSGWRGAGLPSFLGNSTPNQSGSVYVAAGTVISSALLFTYWPHNREQKMNTDVGRRGSWLQHRIQAMLLWMTWWHTNAHIHSAV